MRGSNWPSLVFPRGSILTKIKHERIGIPGDYLWHATLGESIFPNNEIIIRQLTNRAKLTVYISRKRWHYKTVELASRGQGIWQFYYILSDIFCHDKCFYLPTATNYIGRRTLLDRPWDVSGNPGRRWNKRIPVWKTARRRWNKRFPVWSLNWIYAWRSADASGFVYATTSMQNTILGTFIIYGWLEMRDNREQLLSKIYARYKVNTIAYK